MLKVQDLPCYFGDVVELRATKFISKPIYLKWKDSMIVKCERFRKKTPVRSDFNDPLLNCKVSHYLTLFGLCFIYFWEIQTCWGSSYHTCDGMAINLTITIIITITMVVLVVADMRELFYLPLMCWIQSWKNNANLDVSPWLKTSTLYDCIYIC